MSYDYNLWSWAYILIPCTITFCLLNMVNNGNFRKLINSYGSRTANAELFKHERFIFFEVIPICPSEYHFWGRNLLTARSSHTDENKRTKNQHIEQSNARNRWIRSSVMNSLYFRTLCYCWPHAKCYCSIRAALVLVVVLDICLRVGKRAENNCVFHIVFFEAAALRHT